MDTRPAGRVFFCAVPSRVSLIISKIFLISASQISNRSVLLSRDYFFEFTPMILADTLFHLPRTARKT